VLLYSPSGRPLHHAEYVRHSVSVIRAEVIETRTRVSGDDAQAWLDSMAKACRSYLTAVDEIEPDKEYNFEPALRELRDAAKHFRTEYGLQEARQLVNEMYGEDVRRLELEAEAEASA
jgi:hypothetical protein